MFQGLEDRVIQAFIPSIPVAVKRVISKKEKFPDFILWSNFYHKKIWMFQGLEDKVFNLSFHEYEFLSRE